ncbi:hypothetical protein F8M41_010647 [Gigaspora margarita]|uniref:Uncharacterized protein n=1 Tax=Gigaspora margarita TaxID=4874 RepID=A0A8H4A2A5_GIGMA|nr:hypothetical protein F8M41_010647 [Gigaspora margarita]
MKYSLITIVSTVENGYFAIFNYTNPYPNFTPRFGLCAVTISYNQTIYNHWIVISRTVQPINSVSYDVAESFIDCIVSINSDNGTTFYEKVQIYPSGHVFSAQEIYSNQCSLRAKIMSFGDLIFDVTKYNNEDNNIYYYNASVPRSKTFRTTEFFYYYKLL